MAATSLHNDASLDSEKCQRASHRAEAYDDSLVGRWCARATSCEMTTKYRIEWNATNVRDRGTERTVWETLLVMERFNYHAGERDQGAVALVLDLAIAFERVSFPVVWAWATHLNFPRKILRVLRTPAQGAVRRMRGEAALDHHGHPLGSLLLRIVMQDASSEVTKIYPPLKWRVLLMTSKYL